MSLNWRVGRVENYQEVCYEQVTEEEAEAQGTTLDEMLAPIFMGSNWYRPNESDLEKLAAGQDFIERLRPLTNTLIWATISVELRGITETNYTEFWLRMRLCERLTGPFLNQKNPETGKWEPRIITLGEVKAHIGLGTNVSPTNWREWMANLLDTWRAETLRQADLPDDRGLPRDMKLSQSFKDACDQMDTLERAMERRHLDDDREENKQFEWDYAKVCNTQRWLDRSADAWEEIECRLEDELEEE